MKSGYFFRESDVIVTSNKGLLVRFWYQWKEEAHTYLKLCAKRKEKLIKLAVNCVM